MGYIYSITSPSGKLYVGKTYHIKKRIACHKCASKKGSAIILHNSIKKYGWDNHLFSILEEVEDEQMDVREMFWIATLHTYCYENKMGMNMTRGGEGQRATWMHDTKRRAKASINFTGVRNPFYGKTHSEKTKSDIGKKTSIRNKKTGHLVPYAASQIDNEKRKKKVIVYGIDGHLKYEFNSISETCKSLGLTTGDISAVLSGKQTHASKMIFRYKTEQETPLTIDVSNCKFKRMSATILLLDSNKNMIKEYRSAKEAANDLGISQGNIARGAGEYKGRPLRSGHRFVYKDEYEINQVINN